MPYRTALWRRENELFYFLFFRHVADKQREVLSLLELSDPGLGQPD